MNTSPVLDEITLEQIVADPDTRREWLKFQLALRGSSFSAIARATGFTHQAICSIAGKRYGNRVVEKMIAEKIGMPADRIWPERYQDYQQNIASARG